MENGVTENVICNYCAHLGVCEYAKYYLELSKKLRISFDEYKKKWSGKGPTFEFNQPKCSCYEIDYVAFQNPIRDIEKEA